MISQFFNGLMMVFNWMRGMELEVVEVGETM